MTVRSLGRARPSRGNVDGMSFHTDQHERLLYGLYAGADALARAGKHPDARDALLATLAEVGLELDGAPTDDLAAARTAIVLSVAIESGVSVYVVDDAAIDAGLRAALEACHGEAIAHDTEYERPALFAAYQALMAATDAPPLASAYALDPHTGALQGARFGGRLVRVYFVHEWP